MALGKKICCFIFEVCRWTSFGTEPLRNYALPVFVAGFIVVFMNLLPLRATMYILYGNQITAILTGWHNIFSLALFFYAGLGIIGPTAAGRTVLAVLAVRTLPICGVGENVPIINLPSSYFYYISHLGLAYLLPGLRVSGVACLLSGCWCHSC